MFIYFFSFFICVFFEPDEGPGSGSKRCFLLQIKLIMENLYGISSVFCSIIKT